MPATLRPKPIGTSLPHPRTQTTRNAPAKPALHPFSHATASLKTRKRRIPPSPQPSEPPHFHGSESSLHGKPQLDPCAFHRSRHPRALFPRRASQHGLTRHLETPRKGALTDVTASAAAPVRTWIDASVCGARNLTLSRNTVGYLKASRILYIKRRPFSRVAMLNNPLLWTRIRWRGGEELLRCESLCEGVR